MAYTKVGYLAAWIDVRHFSTTQMHTPRLRGQPRYFLTQCIRVKNEARFLPELIAHHLGVGVQHIYIYNNNSSDNLSDALAPFVAKGVVSVIDWPKQPASPSCYVHFLQNFGDDSEWVAFTDADEFICEDRPGRLLQKLKSGSVNCALGLNWLYFGGAGHHVVQDGLITEQFTRSASTRDSHIKVIAKPSKITRYFNSHNFFYVNFGLAEDMQGNKILGSRTIPSEECVYIRHYVFRSTADYLRKTTNGFVDSVGENERARRKEYAEREAGKHSDASNPMPNHHLEFTSRLLYELGFEKPYLTKSP